ncbi:hypothetical protein J9B83_11660 [Marinomonas sp. A79]|uniref:Glycosyl transferase family 2 n=1 Tax=Marinomonas vulgaris TaxID=2823372 RepID=A0ABS5HD81_9GAMM|nr:hypothetical protein [Marinomonas vulgaris]MBR7889598.1 hypothetical protein [Marinomonas vulgaris]
MISKIIKKLKKNTQQRKKIMRNMRDIQSLIDTSIKVEQLQASALHSTSPLVSNALHLNSQVIVSLTTFSTKIHEVHLAIESIGEQSVQPNRIILWLDENEFSEKNLPEILLKQKNRGLEINFCPNYKSYKKIIPTILLYPDAYIITIDDDFLYAPDTIDILVQEQKKSPQKIIGHRAHRIKILENGKPDIYKKWGYDIQTDEPSHQIMLTGCGGILYPPNSLHKDTVNIELFSKLCPNADDLWLKVMAIRNNTECKKTGYSSGGLALKNNRNIGLAQHNIKNGGNDVQFEKVLEHYDIIFS